MDYTTSDAYAVDATTGRRLHQDTESLTTAVSAADLNMVIWSLMEVLNQAGIQGTAFDPSSPPSYQQLRDALNATFADFSADQNYSGRTLRARVQRLGADPRSLGALSDGVRDDTPFIVEALKHSGTLDLRNGTWLVTRTIDLPADCTILAEGATVTFSTGSAPGLQFVGGKKGLTIKGGTWQGTAGSFLRISGKSDRPTAAEHYAFTIRLQGVNVSSKTIVKALEMQSAVHDLFAESCYFYCQNGVESTGKCVEIMFQKTIIFGVARTPDTFGVSLTSSGGTRFYNEGWTFTDCTVDNFDVSWMIDDVFGFCVTGGYTSGFTNSFVFGKPKTTTHCSYINLTGFTCGSPIKFAPDGGRDYVANIVGLIFNGINEAAIQCANNASGVSIRSCKFTASPKRTATAVLCNSNNYRITLHDLDIDATYQVGVQFNAPVATGCSVAEISHSGSGPAIVKAGAVTVRGVGITSPAVAAHNRRYNDRAIGGRVALGVPIARIPFEMAAGQTGSVHFSLPCRGMDAGNQRLDIEVPDGVMLNSGENWNQRHIFPSMSEGLVSGIITFYCAKSISGEFSVSNGAGNPVNIGQNAYFGVEADW